MLFNSIDFAVFLPIVFILHWFVARNSLRAQNLLIVIASFIFYGWWDWRFLSLIVFSIIVDYSVSLAIWNETDPVKRKYLLWTSMLVNLGFLGFFKYYDFFIDNFTTAFTFFGAEMNASSLNIILPVGISFYTFQTMSYTIDVYRKQLEPTRDIVAFSAFVNFFPLLVAGPIERGRTLLPQFYVKRTFDHAKAADGMRQILWGLFKKVVIADNCAIHANEIFNNSHSYPGSTLILGAIFFAFQIYGDFSGYSDIAIGTARLFGISAMRNFAFPYFSRDVAEFWRRWHISLSTWFRDYLYIPLGGSKGGTWMKVRNTFIIFIVSGFWHGANWTFIVWGALNALYFLPILLTNTNRAHLDIVAKGRTLPTIKELSLILTTFSLTVLAWVFFRADSIGHATAYIAEILSPSFFTIPDHAGMDTAWTTMILIVVFVLVEWQGREGEYAISRLGDTWKRPVRYTMYAATLISIFWFGGSQQEFIYFQF